MMNKAFMERVINLLKYGSGYCVTIPVSGLMEQVYLSFVKKLLMTLTG